MGEKRLMSKEKEYIELLIKKRKEGPPDKRKVSFGDMEALVVEMSDTTKEKLRHPTTAWKYFKKVAPDLVKMKSRKKGKISLRPGKKMFVSELAAKKVLEELKPVMGFMNKPPEYLAPLEALLAENTGLKKELAALKAKNSADSVVQLKKELKQLQGFLVPAKILLQLTCGLRQQAMGLTKKAEELKKKNGTDLNAFLVELEESEALK